MALELLSWLDSRRVMKVLIQAWMDYVDQTILGSHLVLSVVATLELHLHKCLDQPD